MSDNKRIFVALRTWRNNREGEGHVTAGQTLENLTEARAAELMAVGLIMAADGPPVLETRRTVRLNTRGESVDAEGQLTGEVPRTFTEARDAVLATGGELGATAPLHSQTIEAAPPHESQNYGSGMLNDDGEPPAFEPVNEPALLANDSTAGVQSVSGTNTGEASREAFTALTTPNEDQPAKRRPGRPRRGQ